MAQHLFRQQIRLRQCCGHEDLAISLVESSYQFSHQDVPLCIENAVLVTRERRRKLLGILAECGPDDYLEQMKEGKKTVVMDASGSDTVSDGFMEVPDTLTNSLSEDNADASFIDACNMLPDVMTLPLCL